MNMFDKLIENLRNENKTIVFSEGHDARVLEAAARIHKEGFLTPILVGNVDVVNGVAKENGFDIEGIEILDPENYAEMDAMVEKMVALRGGKMSPEDCRAMLMKGNYFGTMLVAVGKGDCMLGGATYSTADTIRPALQLVKTRPGSTLVSSCFVLVRGAELEEMMVFGDCGVNISYHDKTDKEGNVTQSAAAQLAEVAIITAETAKSFGLDPKVAMLSFSTKGSAKGPEVSLVQDATRIAKEMAPELPLDGEMQFDAAVSPEVGQRKFPGSPVAGYANTFIFPNLDAGNIGYKIAQRCGGYLAFGPILQGLNAPINDLSRGCTAEEVYLMSIITASIRT